MRYPRLVRTHVWRVAYHDLCEVCILLLLDIVDLMHKLGVPGAREGRHFFGELAPANGVFDQPCDILRRVGQRTSLVRISVIDEGHVALEGMKLLSKLGVAVLREGSCQVVQSLLQGSSTLVSL